MPTFTRDELRAVSHLADALAKAINNPTVKAAELTLTVPGVTVRDQYGTRLGTLSYDGEDYFLEVAE